MRFQLLIALLAETVTLSGCSGSDRSRWMPLNERDAAISPSEKTKRKHPP
jgi:hypothetical protein